MCCHFATPGYFQYSQIYCVSKNKTKTKNTVLEVCTCVIWDAPEICLIKDIAKRETETEKLQYVYELTLMNTVTLMSVRLLVQSTVSLQMLACP